MIGSRARLRMTRMAMPRPASSMIPGAAHSQALRQLFDPKADVYTLRWFDCMGAPPEIFKGSFEGDVLKLAHGGPGMHVRLTYDLSEPGHLSMSMETSQDGAAWNRLIDGRLQRSTT